MPVAAAALSSAIASAREAALVWATTPVGTRAARIERLAPLVARRAREIAHTIADEVGKPVSEALFAEVLTLAEHARTMPRRARAALAPEARAVRVAPHKRTVVERVPWGVVGLVTPWNFPLAIPGTELVCALLAGNAVVLKPSELAPCTATLLHELVVETGLDPRLCVLVEATRDAGRALVDGDVDYLAFTGSTATGLDVAARLAGRGVPFRIETGGKGTAIVLDDAPLGRTAAALTWGAFLNAGQVCAAVQRAFVARAVVEPLAEAIAARARALTVGDPLDESTEIGRLTPPGLAARVAELVDDALARGARLVTGSRPDPADRVVAPIVLVGEDRATRLLSEECFGPVLFLTPVEDDDDALAAAHAAAGDLVASVFARDERRAARLADRLRFGTVLHNDVVWSYGMAEVPWGGVRKSGLFPTHGDEGLRGYTFPRHVAAERLRLVDDDPLWFPYSKPRFQLVEGALKALYAGRSLLQETVFDRLRRRR